MTDIIVNAKTGIGEGFGAVVPMPRVTIKLTARQLDLMASALACHCSTTDSAQAAAEDRAMVNALLAIVNEGGIREDCVYDISLAPEVSVKFS